MTITTKVSYTVTIFHLYTIADLADTYPLEALKQILADHNKCLLLLSKRCEVLRPHPFLDSSVTFPSMNTQIAVG